MGKGKASDGKGGTPTCAVPAVAGRVWELSQEPQGCRQIQTAMESPEKANEIAAELKGHVLEAMRCPHANHVLQKYITAARPQDSQFILSEILEVPGAAEAAARHKYGCRIVQRLVEHCPPWQSQPLCDAVLKDVPALARHPYGNYVLQNFLEHGSPKLKKLLAVELGKEIVAISHDSFGGAVVSCAMSHLEQQDVLPLAETILKEDGLLTYMAQSRHGHSAVRYILKALHGQLYHAARDALLADVASLRASRYGRAVLAWLETAEQSTPTSV